MTTYYEHVRYTNDRLEAEAFSEHFRREGAEDRRAAYERLAGLGLTHREIAALLGPSSPDLHREIFGSYPPGYVFVVYEAEEVPA